MTLRHNKKSRVFLNENHDNCTSCNREFKNNDCTHLGYDKSNSLINVGDCCSRKLVKTIIRHNFRKREYQIPHDDTVLWRFMDFTKYVSLISTGKIFFSRSDLFNDPYEGAKGIKRKKKQWDDHYIKFFKEVIENPPPGYKNQKSEKQVAKRAKELLKSIDQTGQDNLKKTFISCWHENDFESEAMWNLYTTNSKEGIAIKTSYKKLYNSLSKNPDIQIGRINYIDYSKRFVGINDSFWFKRKSFQHEREVRAIIKDLNHKDEFGKLIEVKLSTLIEEVYVSPNSQSWFKDLVQETTNGYGIKRKIKWSKMNEDPFY